MLMIEDPESPKPHENMANLMAWSLAVVAICLTVTTLFQVTDHARERMIDEYYAGLSFIFLTISLAATYYLNFRRNARLLRICQWVFLLALVLLLLSPLLYFAGI